MIGSLVLARAGWSDPSRTEALAMSRDHVALHAGPLDRCRVDGEIVVPQSRDFDGGCVTSKVAGPLKGGPGTGGW